MGKKKSTSQEVSAPSGTLFGASDKTIDPALASLFTSSSGPVTFTRRERVPLVSSDSATSNKPQLTNGHDVQRNELDSATWNHDFDSPALEGGSASSENEAQEADQRPRKRRRVLESDDIETQYLNRLVREEAQDQVKQRKRKVPPSDSSSADSKDSPDASEIEDEAQMATALSDFDGVPLHETMAALETSKENDSTARTVFLGNVSTEAIKSKSARRTLEKHLTNVLQSLPRHQSAHKVESLRFRSTAFVGGSGPKKAAFAKKELMDQTTKSTNAYVVYSNQFAAKQSAAKLNGAMILDRHIRADYLANPARIDHRRCVFVGNLSFVDEETPIDASGDGQAATGRAKAKVPADAEEGLWRTFGKAGEVESVRVVRDKETRIGKGFAYVQFVNENAVEAALLMNEKKFPPMLPRKLRVMRAKKLRSKRTQSTEDSRKISGKFKTNRKDQSTGKEPSRAHVRSTKGQGKPGSGFLKAKSFVFEGSRASSTKRSFNANLKRKKRPAVKPTNRSSRRGAAFKAAGGRGSLKPKEA